MHSLEELHRKSQRSESFFQEKRILFIGSESYDAATITILQGLSELGFAVYTPRKWNINSWFCNIVIDDPSPIKYDFILSNLHWGTRWQYYTKYRLTSYPKVLIDGDDNRKWHTWKDKYSAYKNEYVFEPLEEIKSREVSPFRWVEDLNGYSPDIVFTSQKQRGDRNTLYLPFGIHNEYLWMFENKDASHRLIDFAHIEGPGGKRNVTKRFLNLAKKVRLLPGNLYNGYAEGEKSISSQIRPFYVRERDEKNVIHAFFRWTLDLKYFSVLNNSKVLIYPGVGFYPFWDSKRPWEAYASGCLVMFAKPNIDVSEYSVLEICKFASYTSVVELIDKCRFLHKNTEILDTMRLDAATRAKKYFSPVPLARYFLQRIRERI